MPIANSLLAFVLTLLLLFPAGLQPQALSGDRSAADYCPALSAPTGPTVTVSTVSEDEYVEPPELTPRLYLPLVLRD
ncbi:MAG: hypothetical protein ACLFU8_07550 [Anaerolineales bacterium]